MNTSTYYFVAYKIKDRRTGMVSEGSQVMLLNTDAQLAFQEAEFNIGRSAGTDFYELHILDFKKV